MFTTPLSSVVQAALQPYARLAQANLALLAEFWFTPQPLAFPYPDLQRLFGPAADAVTEAPGEPVGRLARGLLENQFRFFTDLMQAGATLCNLAPPAAGGRWRLGPTASA